MARFLPFVLVITMAAVGLSGCISGDDAPNAESSDGDKAEEARATKEFGAITGQVLDNGLEPVIGATVFLVIRGEQQRDTQTDREGRYTFNEIAPGAYAIQVSAAGYGSGIKQVDVRANEITDASLQVPKLSDAELGLPYVDARVMEGFLACGAGQAIVPADNPVYPGGFNPRASPCGDLDENDEFLFTFFLEPGLQELVIGMTWQPVGGVSGQELNLNMEVDGCGLTCPENETYAEVAGPPDLVFQITDEDLHPDLAFSALEGSKKVQLRVFPAATQTPNLIYQQPYTIHVEMYYNQYADDARNPIPDQ